MVIQKTRSDTRRQGIQIHRWNSSQRSQRFRSLTGFTLVELIVVITILVILGTIAFVSLGGFSGSARDSSRVSDLSLISKSLDIHYTKLWSFPSPTSSTGITFGSSSSVVWYQGTIGEWVIRSLGWAWARISTKPVDPLSKEEYRYSLPTGVNEYLLAADYEGDSVALLQNWGLSPAMAGENWEDSVIARLVRSNLGKNDRGSDLTKEEDLTWIATLRSRWQDFTPPVSASTGSPTISYLKGTYNGVATRVSSGSTINIIALPSIFLSPGSTGTIVDASSRNFLLQGKSLSWVSFAPKVVYSSGALPSNDTERLLFSSGIVAAYSGTSLATNSDIKSFIDNVNSTGSLSAIGGNFVRNKFGGNGPSIVATASSASSSSYSVGNSLMFNGSNQFLSRTGAVNGNRKKWTWSGWVKRAGLSSEQMLLSAGADNNNRFTMRWYADGANDRLFIANDVAGVPNLTLTTNQVFRDPSAWQQIAVTVDTTQTGASDRVKVYLNGDQITSFVSPVYPGKDADLNINAAVTHTIGRNAPSSLFFYNGYISDVNFVDSWALDPTAFGQFDSTTGQWTPKAYTGDYGTNGFHLDFSSGAIIQSLGADSSGKWNHWTVNNMNVATNQMIDTPTNNFATWNPVAKFSSNCSISDGGLKFTNGSAGSAGRTFATFPINSGKWYMELSVNWGTPSGSYAPYFGFVKQWQENIGSTLGDDANSWAFSINGGGWTGYKRYNSTPNTLSFTIANNTWFWLRVDADAGAFDITPDGTTWYNVYNTMTGALLFAYADRWWIPDHQINFWQGGQSGLVYNSAAGGYFKFTPPTWYKALSTTNLPDPAIKNPKQFFDVLTYTGNGSSQSMTGLSFQPDLVWLKDRTSGNNHGLWDSTRLATKYLMSNSGASEVTDASSLSSFLSNGFSLGSNAWWNKNNNQYVGWTWKEWSGTGANGSGFDIETWTGNGSNRFVGHTLSSTPQFIMVKRRDNTAGAQNWRVYHASGNASPASGGVYLNLANQFTPDATLWNNSIPTSTGFSVGTDPAVNANGGNYVAYLWSEVPWFSKFGSYTGNGSATGDGPFVYTGFKPRYVMIKRTDTNWYNWSIHDTARDTYNPSSADLFANLTNTEGSYTAPHLDILSNGFKIRSTSAWQGLNEWNATSPAAYIYAAFAEAPLKYATAR